MQYLVGVIVSSEGVVKAQRFYGVRAETKISQIRMNKIFCINCNRQVKDDEDYHKVDDLSASEIEANHGCELIAASIICKECWGFISKECSNNGQTEKPAIDGEDIEPLIDKPKSLLVPETQGTKRKLLNNDLELTIKTARKESVSQAGLMVESVRQEEVNGSHRILPSITLEKRRNQSKTHGKDCFPSTNSEYLERDFEADLWQEEGDGNINLMRPSSVHVPVWSVPLELCAIEPTDADRNLNKNNTLCINTVDSSSQLQSFSKEHVDDASQIYSTRSNCYNTCSSTNTNILSSSIPSPPPPPTWPSRVELKRLVGKLSDSTDTLTRHSRPDDRSARCNRESTTQLFKHSKERSSRGYFRNNQDNNQTFTHLLVPTIASLMLASLAQNKTCRTVTVNQQHKNNSSSPQYKKSFCSKLSETGDNQHDEIRQPSDCKKEDKKKKKRRGRPRNGGRTLPDGTRMKRYKRPLPGSKVNTSPVSPAKTIPPTRESLNVNNEENVVVSNDAEGKKSKPNEIITIGDASAEDSSELIKPIQPSVNQNHTMCGVSNSDAIITIGDTEETELSVNTTDSPTEQMPQVEQVEDTTNLTKPIQPSGKENDVGYKISKPDNITAIKDTEKSKIATKQTSLMKQADNFNKLNKQILPSAKNNNVRGHISKEDAIINISNTEETQLLANTADFLKHQILQGKQAEDSRKLNQLSTKDSDTEDNISNTDAISIMKDSEETKLTANTSDFYTQLLPSVKQEDSKKLKNRIQPLIKVINYNEVNDEQIVLIYSTSEEISADQSTSVGSTIKEISVADADKTSSDTSPLNQKMLKKQKVPLQENSCVLSDENAKTSTESIYSDHSKSRNDNATEQDSDASTLTDTSDFQRDVKSLLTDIEQEYKLLEFFDDSNENESIESSDNANRESDKSQLQNQLHEKVKPKRKRRRTGRPRNGGNKYLCLETNRLIRNPRYKRPKPETLLNNQPLPLPPLMPDDLRFNNFSNDQ